MSSVNYLANLGLTNRDSESYGDLASARISLTTLAMCGCGYMTYGTHEVNCPQCKKSLYWESVPNSRVQGKLVAHQKRTAKVMCVDTMNNLKIREWKGKIGGELTEVAVSSLSGKMVRDMGIMKLAWDFEHQVAVVTTATGVKMYKAPIRG